MFNYLKRRFSSGDLQGELDDQTEHDVNLISLLTKKNENSSINNNNNNNMSNSNNNSNNNNNNGNNFSNILNNFANNVASRKGPSPSAPSSPSKNLSFTDSVMNVARVMMNTNINNSNQTSNNNINQYTGNKSIINRDKTKILLVIDDEHTDWSRFFRNRKLIGDFEIRVEQAEFKNINLAAYSDSGVMVDIDIIRNGSKVVRSFKPDFVLIRQHIKDVNVDWKNIIIGLQYGNVPSINSLYATYNFLDRAWVFSELLKINRKLGNETFPLITQAYYPNHKELLTSSSFPCVVKIGDAHQGLGKFRVQNPYEFQDVSSIVAMSERYSTSEPFIESKCDVQIQKIGTHYKAFIRKSITNQWKANTGSAMLEQVPMNDRYKLWIDEISKLFGGLDICAVKAIMDNNSKEHIIQVSDSAFTLLGESQDEDRRHMAELIIEKLNQIIKTNYELSKVNNESSRANMTSIKKEINNEQSSSFIPINNSPSPSSIQISNVNNASTLPTRQLPSIPNRQPSPTKFHPSTSSEIQSKISLQNNTIQNTTASSNTSTIVNSNINNSHNSSASNTNINNNNNNNNINSLQNNKINPLSLSTPSSSSSSIASTHSAPPLKTLRPQSNNNQTSQLQRSTEHGQQQQQQQPQRANSIQISNQRPPPPQRPYLSRENTQNSTQVDDSDDTMKNLRKTFAGIFGEM